MLRTSIGFLGLITHNQPVRQKHISQAALSMVTQHLSNRMHVFALFLSIQINIAPNHNRLPLILHGETPKNNTAQTVVCITTLSQSGRRPKLPPSEETQLLWAVCDVCDHQPQVLWRFSGSVKHLFSRPPLFWTETSDIVSGICWNHSFSSGVNTHIITRTTLDFAFCTCSSCSSSS